MGVQLTRHITTIVDAQNIGSSGTIGSSPFDASGLLGAIFRFTATNSQQLAAAGVVPQWSRDGGAVYATLNPATGGELTLDLATLRDLSTQAGLVAVAFLNQDTATVSSVMPSPHDHVRLSITNGAGLLTGLTVTMQGIIDAREAA